MSELALTGFGIGLRPQLTSELARTTRAIDWLEITAENWIDVGGLRRRELEQCAERWPLATHSVSMSIGGPDPLDEAFFRKVTELCHHVGARSWSDHLCQSVLRGTHSHDLLPLPYSEEALAHVVARINLAKRLTDVPLLFENATSYVRMPGATMPEVAFLRSVVEKTGCGMLLDVNNVYVNSQNHGFDPEQTILELPLDRVEQIHLAGHTREGDLLYDSHIGPIAEPVWALYRRTLSRAGRMIPTLIEWDQEIPGLDAVLDELDRARREASVALCVPAGGRAA